ncbi:cation diffusion facilitator family transporter [Niallia sp. Krafla_26]|uniref:cation diffusion facilitator family transporter n=1 Tax=Niallia sp. Krafla_26 TaxID=3064703 RepID=UPI003D173EF5
MKTYDYHHLDHIKKQQKSKRALWITLLLTIFFTLVEVVGGMLSNSLALLSDSAHMLSDVLALGLSMTAIYMATRNPNKKYTFGYLRFEILASFINGLALVVISVVIFIEGIKRMITPSEINFTLMLTIAIIGLIVNIVLTIVLSRSTRDEENLNIKSALWHFIGDLLNSIGVIISALLIWFTGLMIIDPIISMIIGGVIFIGGAKIIRESYLILMETVPDQFDLDLIRQDILSIKGVENVHEMHLWTITTNHYSLTAHIFVYHDSQASETIANINELLASKYQIVHSTIQIENPMIHDHGQYGKDFLRQQA